MGKLLECALCKKESELKLSHIIPKFVFRYLKKDSFTGKIRKVSDPNKPLQDGDKMSLLCNDCEQLFSRKEVQFANKIYYPFKKEGFNKLNYDGNWLNHFITSVNWRILYLDIEGFEEKKNDQNKITENQLNSLKKAEEIMRLYLLGKRMNLDNIENHIFFFDKLELVGEEVAHIHPHSSIQGSAYSYTFLTKPDLIYVFTNLTGIIIVTIIKKYSKEKWKNTYVKNEPGIIKAPQSSNSPVMSELLYIDKQRQKYLQGISEKQRQQILDKIKENPEKFKESGTYQRILKDKEINVKH